MKQAWIFLSFATVLLSMSGCVFTTTSAASATIADILDPTVEVSAMSTSGENVGNYEQRTYIKKRMLSYIGQNPENVRRDIAAGSGGHLDALITILMIRRDSADRFKLVLQENFHKIYPTESEPLAKIVDRIYDIAY